MLKQELREPAIYNSVITAVASGASHSNEIATKVGIESPICAKYLKVLLDLGILVKETPITEKAGKKTIYAIGDNFFRFWYRFVPQNTSAISAGKLKESMILLSRSITLIIWDLSLNKCAANIYSSMPRMFLLY